MQGCQELELQEGISVQTLVQVRGAFPWGAGGRATCKQANLRTWIWKEEGCALELTYIVKAGMWLVFVPIYKMGLMEDEINALA